jgi:hypothetical protein
MMTLSKKRRIRDFLAVEIEWLAEGGLQNWCGYCKSQTNTNSLSILRTTIVINKISRKTLPKWNNKRLSVKTFPDKRLLLQAKKSKLKSEKLPLLILRSTATTSEAKSKKST